MIGGDFPVDAPFISDSQITVADQRRYSVAGGALPHAEGETGLDK